MSLKKILFISSAAMVCGLGGWALFKQKDAAARPSTTLPSPERVEQGMALDFQGESPSSDDGFKEGPPNATPSGELAAATSQSSPQALSVEEMPDIDRVAELFSVEGNKLPIVETIRYSSSVSWLKGRPAWIADYASHYHTSRHFIARSLNGKPDYLSQNVSIGSRFNVLRTDRQIQFHLVADLSRCKMALFYYDMGSDERVWLKTYPISVGKADAETGMDSATPEGSFRIGGKVGIYKVGSTGYLLGQKVEMVRHFGTRWLPFAEELKESGSSVKGLGISGLPWVEDSATGLLVEDLSMLKQYASNGCIWMSQKDIEELFAIVITRPCFVSVVKDFHQAELPGKEKR